MGNEGNAKVLIIGSGGREHALGWKLGQSDHVSNVLYAPGNAGTQEGKGINVTIDGSKKAQQQSIVDLIEKEVIDMTIVGPEQPLCDGLVDFLASNGYHRVIGPSQAASALESDKFFSYEILKELRIPQADSIKCSSEESALAAIPQMANASGVVIKARGLTGGKGVTVCDSVRDARDSLKGHIQAYGGEVLIAQRLSGPEYSVFGLSDGKTVIPLELSLQDHKRLYDGDKGPNTGGMGAYGPVFGREITRHVVDSVMNPVIEHMRAQGKEYKGFLYAGMMMTDDGPKVIEFNIRFGDPECQAAMMMLEGDLYEPLSLSLEGRVGEASMKVKQGSASCVVLASKGYPDANKLQRWYPITGINDTNQIPGVKVFHAGTIIQNGNIVNSGGRVLGVTGYSPQGVREANSLAYQATELIHIPHGFQYRRDIAHFALRGDDDE